MTRKIGFYSAGDLFVCSLQCFLCYETLSSCGVKPSVLLSHFQGKYSGLSSKLVESSQIKYKIMFSRLRQMHFLLATRNRTKSPRHQSCICHSKSRFAEKFATSTSKLMANILKGKRNKLVAKSLLSDAALACHIIINGMKYGNTITCVRMTFLLCSLLKSLMCGI